jgi:hypothetical protein
MAVSVSGELLRSEHSLYTGCDDCKVSLQYLSSGRELPQLLDFKKIVLKFPSDGYPY